MMEKRSRNLDSRIERVMTSLIICQLSVLEDGRTKERRRLIEWKDNYIGTKVELTRILKSNSKHKGKE